MARPSPAAAPAGVTTHRGYFVIADISGYTRFVSQNELEHAQGVLHELVTVLMEQLSLPLRFVALEGDAVFCYAPDGAVTDAEHLVQLMESCYSAFILRQQEMASGTTCVCSACRAMHTLNLKCVAHYGTFATQQTPNGVQLVGADVTLVHLLLKNSVVERTGIKPYALLTAPFVAKARFGTRVDDGDTGDVTALGLLPHEEQVEPFGTVRCGVLDLSSRVDAFRERQRAELEQMPVAMELKTPMPGPAAIVWRYITDPALRPLWQLDIIDVQSRPNPGGRTDVDWQSHCHHGGYLMQMRMVDWQPFRRMGMHTRATGKSITTPPQCRVDFHFDDQTPASCTLRFVVRLRDEPRLKHWMFRLVRPLVRREWQAHFDKLAEHVAADLARDRTLHEKALAMTST